MSNNPDQILKPPGFLKLCEKCNVQVRSSGWSAHLKSQRHLSGKPDPRRKVCKICNIEMVCTTWHNHLRSKHRLKNSSDTIIEPIIPRNRNIPTKFCEKCNVEISITHLD